jgi:hypothetical protein
MLYIDFDFNGRAESLREGGLPDAPKMATQQIGRRRSGKGAQAPTLRESLRAEPGRYSEGDA